MLENSNECSCVFLESQFLQKEVNVLVHGEVVQVPTSFTMKTHEESTVRDVNGPEIKKRQELMNLNESIKGKSSSLKQ